jgi:hypothetical protein
LCVGGQLVAVIHDQTEAGDDVEAVLVGEADMANGDDTCSVEELCQQALDPDWKTAEAAIHALHRRGGREVLDAALAMAVHPEPFQ